MSSLALVRDTVPATRRHIDVCEVVEELRRQSPRAGADRIAALLAKRIEEDHHLLVSASRFIAEKLLAAAATARQRQRAAPSPTQRAERRIAERAEATKIAAKVKETLLLDLLMPNGVPMRFCSGTQMAGFGKAYAKIGETVGDAMVGEVLVEHQVRELLRPT
jgi:hypothetical protein